MVFLHAANHSAEFLKTWLLAAEVPVDAGALHPSQPVYTSKPLVERGAIDPLRGVRRWTQLIDGDPAVEPIAEDLVRKGAVAAMRDVLSRRWRRRALDTARTDEGQAARLGAALRIRQAKDGDRHKTILRESFFLAHLILAGAVDQDEAMRTLLNAGRIVGKQEDEVRRAFNYALDKVASIVARWFERGDQSSAPKRAPKRAPKSAAKSVETKKQVTLASPQQREEIIMTLASIDSAVEHESEMQKIKADYGCSLKSLRRMSRRRVSGCSQTPPKSGRKATRRVANFVRPR